MQTLPSHLTDYVTEADHKNEIPFFFLFAGSIVFFVIKFGNTYSGHLNNLFTDSL